MANTEVFKEGAEALPRRFVYRYLRAEGENMVGMIVENGELMVGMLNNKGIVKKLAQPVLLKDLETGDILLLDILKKIPLENGFTEKDREHLVGMLKNPAEEKRYAAYVKMSNEKYEEMVKKYDVQIDKHTNEITLLKKDMLALEESKTKILQEKSEILEKLEKCKNDALAYMQKDNVNQLEATAIAAKITAENKVLQEKLDALLRSEQQHTDLDTEKGKEIATLKANIGEIKAKLDEVTAELEKRARNTERCTQVILMQKKKVIKDLKETNKKWKEWSATIKQDVAKYKSAVLNEYRVIQNGMKRVLEEAVKDKDVEIVRLKQNIKDIRLELEKVVAEQVQCLHEKESEQQALKENAQCADLSTELQEKDTKMEELQRELAEVKKMLMANEKSKVPTVDYQKCFTVLNSLVALNNIFARKQEIIQRLETIIKNDIGSFKKLTEAQRDDIKSRFETVKAEIKKHIDRLDLSTLINSANFTHLKNKATHAKVEPDYCIDVSTLVEYWNEFRPKYNEQDRMLTNIYEDLSGAVRVYVRVKPLVGVEQKEKTVGITKVEDKKQRSVFLDCSGVPNVKNSTRQTFGDFYGVFEDGYTNLDVYTGLPDSLQEIKVDGMKLNVDDIVEKADTVSPGLYNVFKQVEDGYSMVLMGYGLSGSGKTFSLLGSNGAQGSNYPGVLHYGLANLRGVKKIRVKYLFEQYYRSVNLTTSTVAGKVHFLIGEPKMVPDAYRASEISRFKNAIPADLDVNDLKVEDMYRLTEVIEKYRTTHRRIKRTPNNPVSSRSNLFMVFEIEFETGKKGYITIVDMAGRESPSDLFKMFLDDRANMVSLSSLTVGSAKEVEKYMRPEIKSANYTSEDVDEILREGFFINEAINHLTYFLNKKNYRESKPVMQIQRKYQKDRFFVDPTKEENKETLNMAKYCLTIPILQFLDSLPKANAEFLPTKFVMMCMVRQEQKYCDQTFETLDFANSIKSS